MRALPTFAGWRLARLGPDALAGLALAAIAIPSQMATARLAGLPPETGLLALAAGAVGFALFGSDRRLSIGADSTIAPIFAGALLAAGVHEASEYAREAATLALMSGLMLALAGALRLSFIANLLSIPVMTGFLAGIAVHIVASQAAALIGVDVASGSTIAKLVAAAQNLPRANPLTLALGLAVFAIMEIGERINRHAPSALIALAAASAATALLGGEAHGVAVLGPLPAAAPHWLRPAVSLDSALRLAPLAAIVAAVSMMQTAATARTFGGGDDLDRDFLGLGGGNLVAGLTGAFPVDASPSCTAVVVAAGATSQLAALIAAVIALIAAMFGGAAFTHVPQAALAGVLLHVARGLIRGKDIASVFRRSKAEFGLILTTIAAIVALPIEEGVGLGILVSILHGVWTTTRARVAEFERIPGTSIWWPKGTVAHGETLAGVRVIGLQAPLSFLNAYPFEREIRHFVSGGTKLLVVECDAIVEIDYTGAKILTDVIGALREAHVDVAFARLESLRAQQSFANLGLAELVGADHLFHSVEEAIAALRPDALANARN